MRPTITSGATCHRDFLAARRQREDAVEANGGAYHLRQAPLSPKGSWFLTPGGRLVAVARDMPARYPAPVPLDARRQTEEPPGPSTREGVHRKIGPCLSR